MRPSGGWDAYPRTEAYRSFAQYWPGALPVTDAGDGGDVEQDKVPEWTRAPECGDRRSVFVGELTFIAYEIYYFVRIDFGAI
jgi:hypothetical protein